MLLCRLFFVFLLLGMLTIPAPVKANTVISSFAFVREDGSLQVSNYHVHLFGIYISPTKQTCYTFVRPVPCINHAALALEFRISGDFIRCISRFIYADGSITASYHSGEQDLSE